MAFDANLLTLMTDTVLIAPIVSQDIHGQPVYGADVSYQAHVEYDTQTVEFSRSQSEPLGRLVITHAIVYLPDWPTVRQRDRVTLPDGSSAPIIHVKKYSDENGPYYSEVWV